MPGAETDVGDLRARSGQSLMEMVDGGESGCEIGVEPRLVECGLAFARVGPRAVPS